MLRDGPDQQPASTLNDVKGAVACGALEQTNTRVVSLKEETKDPNQDGRLHRVSRSSKTSKGKGLDDSSKRIAQYSDDGETDWMKQIGRNRLQASARKKNPKRKTRTKAKPKDDDDHDPSNDEESKMDVGQNPPDFDSNDQSQKDMDLENEENKSDEERIMHVMEKAMTDPERNSTMKRIIDQEVMKRIRALQDAAERGRNPDNVNSSDESSGKDSENQRDDNSRTERYDRRSFQLKITIRGFNNGRLLDPEQLAFRSNLMDFGINYESAEEIMRGGMSNIREITDLSKESIKSFMHGLKSISPDCPRPKSIHYGNRLSSRLLMWANWARYQPLIGVKP
eukprot:jgi/Psemu1/41038/gm1.41038_g